MADQTTKDLIHKSRYPIELCEQFIIGLVWFVKALKEENLMNLGIHNINPAQTNPQMLSNPLIVQHLELLAQAQERFGIKRYDDYLKRTNQMFEGLLGIEPSPPKPEKTQKTFINKNALVITKIAREEGLAHAKGVGELYSTLKCWMDYQHKKTGYRTITTNIRKLAKHKNVSRRTIDYQIAELKKLNIFEFSISYHVQFGRELTIKPVGEKSPPAIENSGKKVIHQNATFAPPERNFSSRIYKERVRESGNICLTNSLESTSSSAYVPKTDEELPKKAEENNKAMTTLWLLFNELILSEFGNRLTVNEIYFLSQLKSLYKSHFGAVEAVEAYIRKVAGNDFLMGRKPFGKGEDRYWQFNLAQIFSAKMIEDSWADSGMFCDYAKQRQDKAREEEEMAKKAQPVRLATLTLEEVVASAKDSTDAQVKTALFHKLGADVYKSWFHDNGFVFQGMDDKSPLFTVSGNYARKIIGERYYHQLKDAAAMCGDSGYTH